MLIIFLLVIQMLIILLSRVLSLMILMLIILVLFFLGLRILLLITLVSCSRLQRSPLTCGACAKKIISGDSITADIIKLAELKPEELLYWSHDNRALSHLPYMIILDSCVTFCYLLPLHSRQA